MTQTAFTVFAADISPDGAATEIDAADPSPVAPPGVALRWLHFDAGAPGFQDWAERRLPRIAAATLGQAETRPRCTVFEEGLAVNLRGVNLNPEGRTEDMVSLRVWIGERLVVTARLRRLMTMEALRDDCRAGRGPTSPGAFLARAAKGLTDRAEEAMLDLEERTDAMEDQSLIEGQKVDFTEIVAVQRAVIMIRRFSTPQREAISRLASLGDDAKATGIERFANEDHVRL
ncbi:MAG: CorA family divalent cation transporter, partial [Paracoccaceae bacterium]